ncbi:M28 family peptidase [Cystobacter fuscus]|uniref:M28 family peptidase n=1 Tax=Cystobacter fuscus TaxID=43 RepID=UPI002B3113D7|nr:M28 family peptidase [Cystobacter fuscus]
MKRLSLGVLFFLGCAHAPSAPAPSSETPSTPPKALPAREGEGHLGSLRQLTFAGENAEAYWAFSGEALTFQARLEGQQCDRIYWLDAKTGATRPISSGEGVTTCAYALPGDDEVIYASTHEAGAACPPKPDMSKGYVWPLYEGYDIYKARADGSDRRPLTRTPGYDAEATVCPKDGSIVFTSVRDGDLELYRMDADGGNVKRLTSTPGYDGGAFFNRDCTKIVWRASRPAPGKELEDYQALLAQGLVRPTKLELYVADADGSNPTQITYLNVASFAPSWHPTRERILFSTNYPNARGREFDIWAVNVDGSGLERITTAPGFDGFPLFSPDGKQLAFSSNRETAPGRQDTNVFIAEWNDDVPASTAAPLPADRVMKDVRFLAAPEQGGRGVDTPGLEQAARYLEQRFSALGLVPAGDNGTFRQRFSVTTEVKAGAGTALELGSLRAKDEAFLPLGFSAEGDVSGDVVLAGYGVRAKELGVDDYAGLAVKGKIVVVRRFVPDQPAFASSEAQRRYGDLRHKAWVAKEAGARALIVVDWPAGAATGAHGAPTEARLPPLRPEGAQDAGLPAVILQRAGFEPVLQQLEQKKKVRGRVVVRLDKVQKDAWNLVGRLPAAAPEARAASGVVVVGAHYDHLGTGGRGSLAPDSHEPHLGADDNASGVAGLLEAARLLAAKRERLQRDVYFTAFSGEELGVLGSTAWTRSPPAGLAMKDVVGMINLDMVGRLRNNHLAVLGVESGQEWRDVLAPACALARVQCDGSGDGYGPSDHTPFYAAGVPVLHFFTGAHGDYHKPSDSASRINAAGLAQVGLIVSEVAAEVSARPGRLTYRNVPAPAPAGDMRSFNASLGTVPDYAPPEGTRGVLLAGVRPGGGADKGGMKRGDVLIRLGTHDVGSVEDLMYALNASKPGETVTAVVLREGQEVKLSVTFQESQRR